MVIHSQALSVEGAPSDGAASGDGAPSSVLIAPWGEVNSANGTFVLDEEAARSVLTAFAAQGTEVPIDYEHQSLGGTYASPTGQAPAAGWIRSMRAVTPGSEDAGESAKVRKWESEKVRKWESEKVGDAAGTSVPGLWAEVEWTEAAREKLVAKEYRYLSPVVIIRKRDRRVMALHSAALTNKPAIVGMKPIINRAEGQAGLGERESVASGREEASLNGALCKGETLVAASASHAVSMVDETLETLRMRLGMVAEADVAEVLVAAEERLTGLMREAEGRRAEERVAQACRAGKLTANLWEWAMTLAMKDPAAFEAWASSAPVVVMLGQTQRPVGGGVGRNRAAVVASARASYRAEPSLMLLTSESAWVAEALREAGLGMDDGS